MANWSNEAEAREQIKALVAEYYHDFKEKKTDFKPGDRVTYASRVFDEKEMCALTDATLDFWLTTGRFADEFEKEFAKWIGVKFANLVNSGSSANLIAFMALTAPELGDRQIKKGDEVITVACGFPTTVTPALQYGAVPVFVDVTVPQYNIDVTKLEAALSPKTKAVMIAHTLGNPFDLSAVKAFCDAHNLWLVEDNCDALGTQYTINGETRFTGTWGDIGTSSFYPPHHMTMGEGGCMYTNSPLLNRLIKSYRDWGRSWFGFLISVKPESGLDRNAVTRYIEDHNVQTRLLFSGNLIKHPCFDQIRGTDAYRVAGELTNTDFIMNNTFWVGVYPGMTDEMIDYMAKIIIEAVNQ